jgi:hypothetical protein
VSVHSRRDCRSGAVYTVGDAKSPTKDLLSELHKVLRAYGPDVRINAIGHKGTTIEDLLDIRTLADKVGFRNIKLYWVADANEKMMEVRLDGPVFPSTSTPP